MNENRSTTEDPEELAGLVRAAQACYDIAKGFGVPFISGKDSLYNVWRDGFGKRRSIPSSLLISAIGVICLKRVLNPSVS